MRILLPVAALAGLAAMHVFLVRVVRRSGEFEIPAARLGIGPVSTLDDDAMKRVWTRLARDPGVRRIAWVRRGFPASFQAKLEPRRAWISARIPTGFAVLDDEGVRLGGEFARLPPTPTGLVLAGLSGPAPAPGRRWKGAQAEAAMEMARFVNRSFLKRLVREIDVANVDGRVNPAGPEIVLSSYGGCRIHWGRPLARPGGFEASWQEKLRNLRVVLSAHPSLSGLEFVTIDVPKRPTVKAAGART